MKPWRSRVFDMWADWCSSHPRTVLYLLVATTLNVVLNALGLLLR